MTSVAGGVSTRERRTAAWLFALAASFLLLTTGGHFSSVDETTMLRTTQALLHGHREVHAKGTPEADLLVVSTHRDGEEVGQYALGSSITAIPGYLVGKLLAVGAPDGRAELLERFGVVASSCLIAALGTSLAYLLARRLGARQAPAVLLSLAYSFGTYALVLDRTWWSDVPASVTLLATVLAAVIGVRHSSSDSPVARRMAVSCGALLALGLWFRFTSLVFVPPVVAYLAFVPADRSRAALTRRITLVAVGAAPLVLGLCAVNWWRYGAPFDTGYANATYTHPFFRGLYDLTLGVPHGLVWYAPPAIAGIWAIVRGRRERRAERLLGAALLVSTLVLFARYTDWYGGQTWGPRYLLSVLPIVVVVAATAFDRTWWWRMVATLAAIGFVLNLALGIAIYYQSVYASSFLEALDHNRESITDPHAVERAGGTIHNVVALSPLVRAAAHLPESVRNTVRLADGSDATLDVGPFPEQDIRARQFYLDNVHMADVWWLRWRVSGGPDWMLVLVPVLLASTVFAARAVWRLSRTSAGRPPPTHPA